MRKKRFAAELGKNLGKLIDDETVDAFLDAVVASISNRFAGERGNAKRDENALNKAIVDGILKSNPLIFEALNQFGLLPMLEKKPHLVFYILQTYPQLLSLGMGPQQPLPPGPPPQGVQK